MTTETEIPQDAGPPPGQDTTGYGPAPSWFLHLAQALHEGQDEARRGPWVRDVRRALHRSGGRVALGVAHAWHARTVLPVLSERAARLGCDTGPYEVLAAAHHAALSGRTPLQRPWAEVLEPVLRQVYRFAYAYEEAYATAYDNARAYAVANGYPDADAYGREYAELTTEPNARAFAEANAVANARAMAAAYAGGDAGAYARTFPGARARAYVRAAIPVSADDTSGAASARGAVCAAFADGLLTALYATRD